MNSRTGLEHRQTSEPRLGRALIVGAVVCLIGAGGILWWRHGGAIFDDMVLGALAWCF